MEDKKEKTKLKIREALAFGWKKTNQRLRFFIVASSIFAIGPLLITLPIDIAVALTEGLLSQLLTVFSILAYSILFMFFIAGFWTILLKTLREERPAFRDFLGKWKYVPRLVGGYILYFLAVFIGLILFIVPGLILLARLYFFDLLIIDKGMGPIQALKESYTMTKGYGWKIFLLAYVVAPILFVLGIVTLLVGILVVIPIVYLSITFFYDKLSNREVEVAPVEVS